MERGDNIENDMVRHLLESIPLEEYDGRSPKEIHYLVYEPFCENSPLSLSKDVPEKVLLKIPMYNLIFFFLGLIKENQPVKLISKGKLPSKIVNPVFSQHFIKEDLDKHKSIKIQRISESLSVTNAWVLAELTGLVKTRKQELNLTRKGNRFLTHQLHSDLFFELFEAFTMKFNWSFNDSYGDNNIGQFGFAYLIDLIARYGNKPRRFDFYTEKYINAFGGVLPNQDESEKYIISDYFDQCFKLRSFERFLIWFGLIHISDIKSNSDENILIKKSDIFDTLFKIE